MELLGHSQMRTTMDIYSHVMPALAREAADRMGALLLTGKGRQTATRNEIGPGPSDECPGPMGGAEGTRTPDPHTGGAAGGGPRASVFVRFRSSDARTVKSERTGTVVNTVIWPPSWHHPVAAQGIRNGAVQGP